MSGIKVVCALPPEQACLQWLYLSNLVFLSGVVKTGHHWTPQHDSYKNKSESKSGTVSLLNSWHVSTCRWTDTEAWLYRIPYCMKRTVLGLAVMVGIFFIAAHTVLWPKNSVGKTLKSYLLLNSLCTVLAPSVSHSFPTVNRLVHAQEIGKGHNQAWTNPA